ncbi:oxygenase MpaB family protein [[Mycobacterium] burgundiense]|uniref:Oxygenase MpaB family protein n=1 Tax=[Mycobacterium] burgundiense TaxID=3064286 RepID=A0ABN9NSD0_9MYCO|nr:oxygenase MpaB family protein [Mycolicibacterium sp. MU0053]CAJ1511130.1 oxygenase MpaB family protein [Mycolicibacterium sp. MU0053]
MNVPIPTRHPDRPRPIPAGVRAIATALAIRKPTEQQWQVLGERLTVGDGPMDRLVEWMAATGMEQTRPLFERALHDGIAGIPDAPQPLRDFFHTYEAPPDWVDADMVRKGQRALRRGGADGMYVARDVSLLGGYQFSGFNKTLIRTGALEKGSNKRFAETMQWAMDVISEDGLEPLGAGYRSTLRVRLIHSFVRRHVSAMPDWRADEWGLPVNQTDMAATLVGALVAPAVGAVGMGVILSPSEYSAVAHLTRYVGWLIGVEDQWLPRDFRDSVRVLAHTLSALAAPDESSRQLAVPMVEDPLAWHYDTLPGLRRRLARAQHLSITSAFLGRRAVQSLGLPSHSLPWYPLLRLPLNLARSVAALAVPGGMERADHRGRREHRKLLRTMIGTDAATIGESAVQVSQVA